ncbi:MAG: hypothetical protein ACREGI_02230 [Candidatus Levyibacteriota bacterium]
MTSQSGGFFVVIFMAAELNQLYGQYLAGVQGRNTRLVSPLAQALPIAEADRDKTLAMARSQLSLAAETVMRGSSIMFSAFDNTRAAGPHEVEGLLDITAKQIVIGIPDQQEGIFPTVLHTLEAIAATMQLSNVDPDQFSLPTFIIGQQAFNEHARRIAVSIAIPMPLTCDPQTANVLILKSQARHLDAQTLALLYWNHIANEQHLAQHFPSHTKVVQVTDESRHHSPSDNATVHIGFLPEEDAQRLYRLIDLRRIRPFGEEGRVTTLRRISYLDNNTIE